MTRFSYLVMSLSVCCLLAFVAFESRFGFDLTDESYYQIWMATPWNFKVSSTHFGFVYHPIYELLQGNVSHLRIFSYVSTFGLAWLAAYGFILRAGDQDSAWGSIVAAGATACSSLTLTAFELPQGPSYNTLAFQAILLATAAIAFTDHEKLSQRLVVCWTIVGVAGALAFLAKPTTGVALGFACVIYCALTMRRLVFPLVLAASIAAGAIVLSTWLIDGSPFAFAERIRGAMKIGALLTASSGALGLLRWDGTPFEGLQLAVLAAGVGVVSVVFTLDALSRRFALTFGPLIVSGVCTAMLVLLFLRFPFEKPFGRYDGLQTIAVLIGSAFTYFLVCGWRGWTRNVVGHLAFLLILPFAYAWGTGRPLWLNLEGANFFWFLASLYLVALVARAGPPVNLKMFVGALSALAAVLFLGSSWEFPTRQSQPLRADNFGLKVGSGQGEMKVAQDLGVYVSSMRQLATKGNFERGTPIIDLTGHSPGAVFLIGGVPPGLAWLSGGYSGSEAYALAALDLAGCKAVQNAWLITETSSHGIPSRILRKFGLELARDYTDLGSIKTTTAIFPDVYDQHLFKPKSPDRRDACEPGRVPP